MSTAIEIMEQFYTANRAERGSEMPILNIDGTKSGQFMHVVGQDSKTYKLADTQMKRDFANASSIEDDGEKDLAIAKALREMVAKLVVSWSFDVECTFDNVVNFLEQAPQVQTEIDVFTSDRKRFFA